MMTSDDPYPKQNIFFVLLRIGLGGFLLWTGINKITTLNQFIDSIGKFALFPMSWEPWIGYLGISCEIVVALCLIFKKFYLPTVLLTCTIFSVFVALFVQAWVRGLELSCYCTGSESIVNSYPWEVSWRVGLLLGGLALLWDIYHRRTSMFVAQKISL